MLFSIPLFSLICLIVFSLSDVNINRRSFARSFLIHYLIIVILIVLIAITGGRAPAGGAAGHLLPRMGDGLLIP